MQSTTKTESFESVKNFTPANLPAMQEEVQKVIQEEGKGIFRFILSVPRVAVAVVFNLWILAVTTAVALLFIRLVCF